MDRVTKRDLEAAVCRLNSMSKRRYRLNGAYGKTQVHVTYEDSSGVNNLTYLHTKRELYDILHGILRYVEHEAQSPLLNSP